MVAVTDTVAVVAAVVLVARAGIVRMAVVLVVQQRVIAVLGRTAPAASKQRHAQFSRR